MKIKEKWVSWEELDAILGAGWTPPSEIDAAIVGGLTAGSIVFASADGFLTEDNANLFWDAANLRLGLGTALPAVAFHIKFAAVEVVESRLSAKSRPWRQWECIDGNWGLAIGINADDGMMHFNYDVPIGTRDKSMIVFDGPNARVGIRNDAPAYPVDIGVATRVKGAVTLDTTLGVTGVTTLTKLIVTGDSQEGINLTATSSQIHFIGAAGEKGISYRDTGDGQRYAMMFPDGSDVVQILNRAANGTVEIHANTAEAGAGGDVLVAEFQDDIINLSVDLAIRSQKELRFYDNGNYVGFEAPALAADKIWVLPAADGPANEVWGTDGAGNLIWRTHDELAAYAANQHRVWEASIAEDIHADNISEGSVTQHVGAIDHDALLNTHANPYKLDDLAAPDDNTDLDFSTTKHGLCPKGTDVGDFLRDDGTWAAAVGADEKVKVDVGAVAGYLGAAFNDGVLRVSAPLSYADGGNFVTLGVDGTVLVDGDFAAAGFMRTDGAGNYAVIPGNEDGDGNIFLGTGAGTNLTAGQALYNLLIGTNAGLSLTTGDYNMIFGKDAGYYNQIGSYNAIIGYEAGGFLAGVVKNFNNMICIGYRAGSSLETNLTAPNILIGSNAGRLISTGSSNIAIGDSSLDALTTGYQNCCIGLWTGTNLTGNYNVHIGNKAGTFTVAGNSNVYVGVQAGYFNVHGANNTAIGHDAMKGTGGMTVSGTVAIGLQALYRINSGATDNTGVGYFTLNDLTVGDYNTAVGAWAGYEMFTTSSRNTLVGRHAGYGVPTNIYNDNTFVGYNCGKAVTTGGTNTFVGSQAGEDITTGDGNVCLGYMAGEGNLTVGNNQLWIANSDTATPLIYGEFDNAILKIYGSLCLPNQNELRFYDNGNYVGFEAPALGADQIWVLPAVDGNPGEVMITSGAGVLSFSAAGSGDVSAAANITDHAIVRGNGGAKGIQDTGILVDDGDNVSGMGTLACGNITITTGANSIVAGGGTRLWLEADTSVHSETIANDTTASAASMFIDTSMAGSGMKRSTSGLKYKHKIEDLELDPSLIHQLRPVSFNSLCKGDDKKRRYHGLVADDIEKVYPEIINYGENKEVESYDDRMFITLLLAEIQRQETRIASLEEQLNN